MKNEASPGRAPSLFLSPEGRGERLRNKFWVGRTAFPEILALKQESRILGQWSNPVSGARESEDSSPWAKQHRA